MTDRDGTAAEKGAGEDGGSIWDKYPNFTDTELRILSTVTAQVLMDSTEATAELEPDLLGISSKAAAGEVAALLGDIAPSASREEVQQVLEDEQQSRQLCLQVLGEVRQYPELADRIAAAYRERAQKMAITETLLLAGALVILAIRLKEIHWTGQEKKITFYESGEAVKQFVKGLLGAGT
jgi:hypothetical protein